MRRRDLALAQMNTRGAFELADMAAGGSIDATQLEEAYGDAAREVGLEDGEASRGGPGTKWPK